jgi:hypothetical protein
MRSRRLALGSGFPPYLVLLRVGFTLPPPLLTARCALTAPFHPYHCGTGRRGVHPSDRPFMPKHVQRRYVFCGTGRPRAFKPASRTLSGTLPCGVRTFLSRRSLLAQGYPAATARSSCQGIVYRETGLRSARRLFKRRSWQIFRARFSSVEFHRSQGSTASQPMAQAGFFGCRIAGLEVIGSGLSKRAAGVAAGAGRIDSWFV